jgi:hypothetical protein
MSLRRCRQLSDRVYEVLQHDGEIAPRQLHAHVPPGRLQVDEEMTSVRVDADARGGASMSERITDRRVHDRQSALPPANT